MYMSHLSAEYHCQSIACKYNAETRGSFPSVTLMFCFWPLFLVNVGKSNSKKIHWTIHIRYWTINNMDKGIRCFLESLVIYSLEKVWRFDCIWIIIYLLFVSSTSKKSLQKPRKILDKPWTLTYTIICGYKRYT